MSGILKSRLGLSTPPPLPATAFAKTKESPMNRILAAALSCAALAALAACSGSGDAPAQAPGKRPVAVRTAVAEPSAITESMLFTGDLESPLSVRLAPKASGRLACLETRRDKKKTPVEEGSFVKAGEIVAEVDHDALEAQVSLAGAQVQAAEVALEEKTRENRRMESLFAEDVATEQQRDNALTAFKSAQASLAQAQAQLRLARANLEDAFVRAPMDGIVVSRFLDPGAMVSSATPIIEIAQIDPLRLMISVPARMLPALVPGATPVQVDLPGLPAPISTVVSRIFPAVDTSTRTASVEILLDNPAGENGLRPLRPGMYATATLRIDAREAAVTIPVSSVIRVLGRQVVFVVRGDTAEAVDVETGIREHDRVEIVSGLAPGDEYVVTGQNKLTDGNPVERVSNTP